MSAQRAFGVRIRCTLTGGPIGTVTARALSTVMVASEEMKWREA